MSEYLTSAVPFNIRWVAEFFLILLLLLRKAPRKPIAALRIPSCFLAVLLIVSLIPLNDDSVLNSSLLFTLILLSLPVTAGLCFHLDPRSCLYYAIIAYSMQHTTSSLSGLVMVLLGSEISILTYAVQLAAYAVLFALLRGRVYRHEPVCLSGTVLGLLFVLTILTEIILSDIIRIQKLVSFDSVYYPVYAFMDMLSAVTMIVLLSALVQRKRLEEELAIVQQLRNREQQHYEMTKDAIEMINVKCHDMRHQIRHIGRDQTIDPDVIKDIEHAINFYDLFIKTGNPTLDTIMAEKGLVCQKNGISINCIIDGGSLSFISEADLASLFGNLMDNAIQAVMNLEEEKRTIGLIVRQQGSLLSIHSHNFFSGTRKTVNGIPLTDKPDPQNHGFGIKSMTLIVEKLGGTISISAKDQVFNLNILIPIPGG